MGPVTRGECLTIRAADVAWRICVVIPARNEELLIERCLRSVLRACQEVQGPNQVDIVVVCDMCDDSTAFIARHQLQSKGLVLSCDAGLVGKARQLGVSFALDGLSIRSLAHTWIASTDADCVVPERWLADQLSYARAGFHAVAGTVDVDCFNDHEPTVRERFRASYLVHEDGSHSHVHGANLGFSAVAYQRVGGWRSLATGEDHDLWQRLQEAGVRAESTDRLRVVTSGRRVGRAPLGFADALTAHNENAA